LIGTIEIKVKFQTCQKQW